MNIIATLNHNMYIYKEASGKSCKLCRSTRLEGLLMSKFNFSSIFRCIHGSKIRSDDKKII